MHDLLLFGEQLDIISVYYYIYIRIYIKHLNCSLKMKHYQFSLIIYNIKGK